MREEWLKDIHDRMADYETDAPGNLWEAIRRKENKPALRMKPPVLRRVRRMAAIAAMLAFILTLNPDRNKEKSIPLSVMTEIPHGANGNGRLTLHGKNSKNVTEEEAKKNAKPLQSAEKRPAQAAVPDSRTEPPTDSTATLHPDPSSHMENGQGKKTPIRQQPLPRKHSRQYTDRNQLARLHVRKTGSERLAFGIFTTGGTASSLNSKSAERITGLSVGPDNSEWKDSPLLGILLFNQGEKTETRIKHRLPIRAGFSFIYAINNRMGIESGITYTYLSSDTKEGSDKHHFDGEQTLHYVGIPLNLKYRLIAWKGFETYISSGISVEKCVSGKLEKKYILGKQLKKTETRKLKIKSPQWSANASAGMQYNLIPTIGIYAEPGISYYFNNGSPVKTVYKDKPFNFNLNLGIRFTLKNH